MPFLPLPPIHPDLRFFNYASYLRRRLGGPAARISVSGGFTCPNRDGTLGTGGCLYCNNEAFTPGILFPGLPVKEQVLRTLSSPGRHRAFRRVIVYFQSYSNSYGPAEELDRTYRSAFCHPDVAGLVVGTRPDCLAPPVLDVLEGIAREHYVCVEIGLQSLSDPVLERVRRGHTVRDFAEAVAAVRKRGIDVGVHLIYGLPGDSRRNFVDAAPALSDLDVQGVKLHHFHVVKGTVFAKDWSEGKIRVPGYGEYVDACADFLERLAPEVAVMRLIGTAPKDLLVAPLWEKGSREMARDVAQELARRESFQGCRRDADPEREGT